MTAIVHQLMRYGFGALFALLACASVHAQPGIVFYLEDEPIYTSSSRSAPGFMHEVVAEMLAELELQPQIEYLPWRRAQAMALRTPNAVIFPLARTPEREDSYQWLCEVIDVPVMFINKRNNPRIDTLEQARVQGGVGVILGTPQEAFLKEHQIPYITYTGEKLYPALALDRIPAIYTAQPEAVYGWRKGAYIEPLQYGKSLQELTLWIASNKTSNLINPQRWCDSLLKVKQTGRYDAIHQRYFGTPDQGTRLATPQSSATAADNQP